MTTLLDRLVAAIEPQLDRPFVFFGHSMGALVAFETARELRRRGLPPPIRLFVSGRRAPTVTDGEAPLHGLPAPSLVSQLALRFRGLPNPPKADPALLTLFVPHIRTNRTLLARHSFPIGGRPHGPT